MKKLSQFLHAIALPVSMFLVGHCTAVAQTTISTLTSADLPSIFIQSQHRESQFIVVYLETEQECQGCFAAASHEMKRMTIREGEVPLYAFFAGVDPVIIRRVIEEVEMKGFFHRVGVSVRGILNPKAPLAFAPRIFLVKEGNVIWERNYDGKRINSLSHDIVRLRKGNIPR